MAAYVPTNRRGRSPTWLVTLLTLCLGSCAYPHLDGALPLQEPPPFTAPGEKRAPDRWWEELENPDLDAQISRALSGNFTLDAAWQRVIQARTLAWQQATNLYPSVNGVADAGGTFVEGRDLGSFGLGLDYSYEPDLWGRIQASVEAQRLRTISSHADFETTALTLSADIASTWYALVEAHAQYQLIQAQVETNLKGVALLEARFAGGDANTSADLLRQRQLVDSTREQAVIVRLRIEQLEHQLAILTGQPPQDKSYRVGVELPELPPLPSTGLPSDLLQRRPDIRREYLSLLAADREVAVAVTAQFPRLDLTASLTTAAESPETLFRDWIASIAGQFVAPLFNAGALRSEVRRNEAVVRQRVAEYGQTVLVAYREVEDALAREKYARERIELIESQIRLADDALQVLREQYFAGGTDFLSVLNSTTEQQRLQRADLSTRLELVLARIELYRSLSGGFLRESSPPGDPSPPPFSDE